MSWKPASPTKQGGLELFLVAGVSLALLFPYRLHFHAGMNDEGVVLQAGRRILDGQVPYRDFDMFYSPASMMLSALWMGVFGTGMLASRWLMLLCGIALTLGIFALSCRLLPRPFCYVPAALFLLSGYSEWPVVSYHWFALTALVWSVVCSLDWLEHKRALMLMAAGVCTGLAGAFLQSEGAVGFIGVSSVVVVMAWRDGERKEVLKRLSQFVGGVALIWLPLLLYLVLQGAFLQFVDNAILKALSGLYHSHGAPYDLNKHVIAGWQAFGAQIPDSWNLARLLWAWESFSTLAVWTLKYAGLFPIMLAACIIAWKGERGWKVLCFFLILLTLAKRERLDLLYTNYLTPFWYLALLLCCYWLWQKRKGLALGVAFFLGFVYFGVLLSTVKYHQSFQYPIRTVAGTLWSREPQTAMLQQRVFASALQMSPPGSSTFAWPFCASFYLLTDTSNPTRLDFMVPGWQSKSQAQLLAQALRDSQVEWIYYYSLGPTVLQDYPNIDPSTFFAELQEQKELVCADYELFSSLDTVEIWRRRP